MPDHGPLIVVLRFGNQTIVDIVTGMSEKAAIADFAGRALANGAELPLIEAKTTSIPVERIAALAGGVTPPPRVAADPLVIPVRGALHAFGHYIREKDVTKARDALHSFFEIHAPGCTLDFAGEPPEPGPAPVPERRGQVIDPTRSHGGPGKLVKP